MGTIFDDSQSNRLANFWRTMTYFTPVGDELPVEMGHLDDKTEGIFRPERKVHVLLSLVQCETLVVWMIQRKTKHRSPLPNCCTSQRHFS